MAMKAYRDWGAAKGITDWGNPMGWGQRGGGDHEI